MGLVTKREILVSIIIGTIMLSIAALCFSVLQDKFFDTKTAYESSLKIDNDKDLLDHAIDTKVGNVLVTGIMEGIDPITFDEIKGNFIRITKIIERYTSHTRTVCNSDHVCHTETYWSWDVIDTEEKSVKQVSFLGRNYSYNLFKSYPEKGLSLSKNNTNTQNDISWDCIYISSHERWSYEVVPSSFSTTMFISTKNGTLSPYTGNKISLYPYKNIKETISMQDILYSVVAILYWLVVLVTMGIVIYQYVMMENDYLEK